jgi:predicted nuclease of restriction endonuclease-like (RecB) superfamily
MTDRKEYFEVLNALKQEIKTARVRAHMSVNQELVLLYWRIGKEILKRKSELGWGSKVIDQLSQDLQHEFPEMKGLSARNLVYMQTFAAAYPDYEFTQQVAAQIPWGHNQVILDKISDAQVREWYLKKTIENGWSRNVMVMQIESQLHEREGKAQTNFAQVLPAQSSDLAQQLFKNEYNFEFLGLAKDSLEKQIERSLVDHIRDFLLELGTGFAFMGTQYKIEVGGDEFYTDMLFYHTRLRCYVVCELKTGKFIPEYAGKLSFYLTAIDRQVKLPDDNPTIGLLLCQDANHIVVEYSLADKKQPLSVSKYRTLREDLPKELETALPSPQQFQHLFETLKEEK